MTPGQWVGLAAIVVIWSAAAAWIVHRKNGRIAELQRQLATALGIIGERDDTLREYDARNARLHADVKAMRSRLPRLAFDDPTVDPPVTPVYDVGYLSLPLETQQAIEKAMAERADPDVTRPYIPTYEAEVPDNDPWKDGLR